MDASLCVEVLRFFDRVNAQDPKSAGNAKEHLCLGKYAAAAHREPLVEVAKQYEDQAQCEVGVGELVDGVIYALNHALPIFWLPWAGYFSTIRVIVKM